MPEQIGQPGPGFQEQEPNPPRLLSPVADRLIYLKDRSTPEEYSEACSEMNSYISDFGPRIRVYFSEVLTWYISSSLPERILYTRGFVATAGKINDLINEEKKDLGQRKFSEFYNTMKNASRLNREDLPPGLTFLKIAEVLIANGKGAWVVENIERFPPEAHQNIFLMLPPDSYADIFKPEIIGGTARFPQLKRKPVPFKGLGIKAARKLENDRKPNYDLGGGYLGPDTTRTTREGWISREQAAQKAASALSDFIRREKKTLLAMVQVSPEKRHIISRINDVEIAVDSQGQLRISNLIPVPVYPELAPKYSVRLDERELLVRELCIAFSEDELKLIGSNKQEVTAELIAAEPPAGKGSELQSGMPPEGKGTELGAANRPED